MKPTDYILIQKEKEKLIESWTDEMISALAFELEVYVMDKDLAGDGLDESNEGDKL